MLHVVRLRPLNRLLLNLWSVMLLLGICLPAVLAQDAGKDAKEPNEAALKEARGALQAYVEKADSSYGWKPRRTGEVGTCKFVEVIMTSQTWHDIVWKHQVFVLVPKSIKPEVKQGLLLIGGGSWRDDLEQPPTNDKLPGEAQLLATMAEKLATPIVILMHCPHQPIFEGRKEDAIIAYTFEKYLKGEGNDWPLLAPMVKSAVRAMDTAQEIVAKDFGHKLETFTVTGGSKRGWTTWLTSAMDKRVTALAPMVIDVLQIDKQMVHQKKTWGELSEEINDYKQLNLDKYLATAKGKTLLEIVDPYRHRAKITQPKLIILGTNDPYWPVDALNLYWNDLLGEKYILYCPNQGHGIKDYRRVFSSMNALHQSVIQQTPLPKMNWKFDGDAKHLKLSVSSDVAPSRVLAWTATTATRDFRKSEWTSSECKAEADAFATAVNSPASGSAALYAEVIFNENTADEYSLCTNLQVIPALPAK